MNEFLEKPVTKSHANRSTTKIFARLKRYWKLEKLQINDKGIYDISLIIELQALLYKSDISQPIEVAV